MNLGRRTVAANKAQGPLKLGQAGLRDWINFKDILGQGKKTDPSDSFFR